MVRNPSPEKRAAFLDTALRLFVARGVQNTSTAAIAQEAGTAAGTLFLYFATKQDLVDALVLKIGREQADYIETLLDPSHSAREAFFAIWEGSLRWFLKNMDAYHLIQQVRDSGLVSAAAVQESNQYFMYYYEAIQKGLAEGRIKAYPVEMIGGFLYQEIIAVMKLLAAQADLTRQDEIIRQGFDIFWDGIKAAGE
ncbi:MAG: TetR/AcrR family transcriptional regulator [Anaerolineales bacterium]|nr:TetR/AcrR family transcriptional regulator [Anaerolineales bacterium]